MKSYLDGKALGFNEDLEDLNVLFNNSAFLWGESIFTTGRLEQGRLHLWKAHLERIAYAYKWLTHENLDCKALTREVHRLKENFKSEKPVRFRVTYFYDANRKIRQLIQFDDFKKIYEMELVTSQIPFVSQRSNRLKVGQYAEVNVLKRNLGSELCLVSTENEVLESSTSNLLFLSEKEEWVTPFSDDFILEGVGLHYGLASLAFHKKNIFVRDLKSMKAAFAVNAVQGPVPILKIDDITFTHSKDYLANLEKVWRNCD